MKETITREMREYVEINEKKIQCARTCRMQQTVLGEWSGALVAFKHEC